MGASDAAGSGWPLVVVPMRITCMIGHTIQLLHLLGHVAESLPGAGILRQHLAEVVA